MIRGTPACVWGLVWPLAGCAWMVPSPQATDPLTKTSDMVIDRQLAADAAQQWRAEWPPARTTLRRCAKHPPRADRVNTFEEELTQQLRRAGYAVIDTAPDPKTSVNSATCNSTTADKAVPINAERRSVKPSDEIHCVIVQIADGRWARCYRVIETTAHPLGPWTRAPLPPTG